MAGFTSLFADGSLSLTAEPLVGNIDLAQTKMLDFSVFNNNTVPVQAKLNIVNLEKTGSFAEDRFVSNNDLDLSASVNASPETFVIAPNAAQSVRVFVTPPTEPGDYFFGVQMVPSKNMGQNAPAARSSNIVIPIFVGQLSTVYVHNGAGFPVVTMSCQPMVFHDTPVIALFIKNTSRWLFRPTYSIMIDQQTLVKDVHTPPVMGLSSGTRYLSLTQTPPQNAKVSVTWSLPDGKSAVVTCLE